MLLKSSLLIFFFYLTAHIAISQTQQPCIEGLITDKATGQAIPDVHIWSSTNKNGSITDIQGKYKLCGNYPKGSILHFSHTAYNPLDLTVPDSIPLPLNIVLTRKEIATEEVVVKGSSGGAINRVLPGQARIRSSDIMNLPTVLGEADVVRAIQQLPGIQSVSEGVGGIFVRGGGPGQNMILFDGMELMNPVHLMGVYSVFNPLIIDDVKIYKGHSPASFRSRISSTIVVSTKNPILQDNTVEGSLGNIASNLTISRRSNNHKWGITAGIRRSYLELHRYASSLILSDEDNFFNDTFYAFYDFNGKIIFHPNNSSQFTVNWYMGSDDFNLNDKNLNYDAGTNYGNQALALQWKKRVAEDKTVSSSIKYTSTWSKFQGDIVENEVAFESTHDQLSVDAQLMMEKNRHLLRTGIDGYLFSTIPQDMKLVLIEDTILHKDRFRNADLGFFLEDTYRCSPSVHLSAGIRGHYYITFEPTATESAISKSKYKLKDGSFYWSPSLSVSWQYHPNLSFKLAWSHNVQMIHLASLSSMPLPNDIWMMSSSRLTPQTSQQLSAGFYRKYHGYWLSSEIFGKLLSHQVIFNVNLEDEEQNYFEDHFFHGKGRAYGMEWSLKKESGALRGSINYTLSRSQRSFPDIYAGKWFSDKFDRTHDLSVMSTWRINDRWDVGAAFIFATGNTITLPKGRMWMMGTVMNDYDGYNNFRMPAYHRLDLSANYSFKSQLFNKSILNFSLINIYSRANPYFIFYKVYQGDNRYDIDIKASQVSLFPFMPSINWRVKF